jgi:hypothetical protein
MNDQFVPTAGLVKREAKPKSATTHSKLNVFKRTSQNKRYEEHDETEPLQIHSLSKPNQEETALPRSPKRKQKGTTAESRELLPLMNKKRETPVASPNVIVEPDDDEEFQDSPRVEETTEEIFSKKSVEAIEILKRKSLTQSWKSPMSDYSRSVERNSLSNSLSSQITPSPTSERGSRIASYIERFRNAPATSREERNSPVRQNASPSNLVPNIKMENMEERESEDGDNPLSDRSTTSSNTSDLLEDTQELLRGIRTNFVRAMNHPRDRDVLYDSLDEEVKQVNSKASFALNLMSSHSMETKEEPQEVQFEEKDDQEVLQLIRERLSHSDEDGEFTDLANRAQKFLGKKKSWVIEDDIENIKKRYTDSPDVHENTPMKSTEKVPVLLDMAVNNKLYDETHDDVEPLVKKSKPLDEQIKDQIKDETKEEPKQSPSHDLMDNLINDIIDENIAYTEKEKKLKVPVQFTVEKDSKPRRKIRISDHEMEHLFSNDTVCQTLEKKIRVIKNRIKELTNS